MEIKESWSIPINKLLHWRAGNWIKYDDKSSSLYIRLYCDQMLITNNNIVLESINISGKIKGIYKEDVLIVIVCTGAQEIRKFKFQIKSNAMLHFQKLGEHFLVVNHNNSSSKNLTMQYHKVEEIFKRVLEDYKDNAKEESNLPTNFNNFVKLCLLDPAFPQLVHETQKIFRAQVSKEK